MEENLMDKIQDLLSDPESMQQISELAQMLQPGSESPEKSTPSYGAELTKPHRETNTSGGAASMGGIDAGMLMQMGELMRSTGNSDKNTALLLALRPHLGEQRQQRIDKALRLLKLWAVFQTMQKTGMLQQLL